MTDKIFRYLIRTTLSPSSRVISLWAELPSLIQEEEATLSLDILLSLTKDSLDILLSLTMDSLDIPHSLKPCIPSCRIKVSRIQVSPAHPRHLDMASITLNHFMSSLDSPSLCLPRVGQLQVTLSESSCQK